MLHIQCCPRIDKSQFSYKVLIEAELRYMYLKDTRATTSGIKSLPQPSLKKRMDGQMPDKYNI